MRIPLSDSSKAALSSKLIEKFGSYAEAARKLGIKRDTLKNYRLKSDSIPEDLYYKILEMTKMEEGFLPFEKIESSHELRIRTRHPPDESKTILAGKSPLGVDWKILMGNIQFKTWS
jgi:hypothetical protein